MATDGLVRLHISGWDADEYFTEFTSGKWTKIQPEEGREIVAKKKRPRAGNGGPPAFDFLIQFGSGISAGLLSNWIYEKIRNVDGPDVEIKVEIDSFEANTDNKFIHYQYEEISRFDEEDIRDVLEDCIEVPNKSSTSESSE